MKTKFLILILCATCGLFGQDNLIPNPGFEDYYDCDYDILTDVIEDIIYDWNTRLGRPRYFNFDCNDSPEYVNENIIIPHQPYAGNGFLALTMLSNIPNEDINSLRYYAQVFLEESLIIGRKYYLEYYVSLTFEDSYLHSGHGVNFTNEFINNTNINDVWPNPPILLEPTLSEDTISIRSHGEWVRIQHCFVADSSFQIMQIGNFFHRDSIDIKPSNTPSVGHVDWTSYDNFFLAEIEQEVRLAEYEKEICVGDCIRLDVQHCTGDYSGDFPEAVTVLEGVDFVAPSDIVVCPQETFSFAIPDIYTVQWSDGETDLEREISEPGVYEYTLDNGACSELFSFELQYALIPETQIEERFACQGDELSFQGLEITESGVFVDTLSTLQGCDSIYQTTIFEFFEDIPFELDGELGFCPEEETMVRIISSHQDIFWSDGDTQPYRFFNQGGIFNLMGTDANGCEVDTQLQIIAYPQLGVQVQDLLDFEFSAGTKLPVTYAGDIAAYLWTPAESLSCPDCPFPTLELPLSGIYQIAVTNEKGCTDLAQLRIEFARIQIYLPTGISKTTPNFVNRLLFAQSNSDITYSLRVYNRWGGLEYESEDLITNDPAVGWIPQADDLGVYVYYVTYVDENGASQLIKGEVTVLD